MPLKRAFKHYTDKKDFCTIGSSKAHIGHLEGAAGLASVIKVILMMQHKKIPLMPNFEKLNSFIQIDNSPLIINTSTDDWHVQHGKSCIAGVSSFGMTGNNAHVVIEEYIPAYIKDNLNNLSESDLDEKLTIARGEVLSDRPIKKTYL